MDDDFYFLANESSDNGSIIQPKMKFIKSKGIPDFDEAIARISDLNIIPLSFYVLGFSYMDISNYISVPEKIVKKDRSCERESIGGLSVF